MIKISTDVWKELDKKTKKIEKDMVSISLSNAERLTKEDDYYKAKEHLEFAIKSLNKLIKLGD